MQKPACEVEIRALLTESKYNSLVDHFNTLAQGEVDDAQTYTFLNSSYNIKVKNLTSKGKAKITLKTGAEYRQQADEYELPIDPTDVQKAVALITALGFDKHIPSLQKRVNYKIDDITVSLKHETNWKYHIEAEIIVGSESKVAFAKQRLMNFFQSLGIKPMTEQENRDHINSILKRYNIDLT